MLFRRTARSFLAVLSVFLPALAVGLALAQPPPPGTAPPGGKDDEPYRLTAGADRGGAGAEMQHKRLHPEFLNQIAAYIDATDADLDVLRRVLEAST